MTNWRAEDLINKVRLKLCLKVHISYLSYIQAHLKCVKAYPVFSGTHAYVLTHTLTKQWTPADTNSLHRGASCKRARIQVDTVVDLQKCDEGNLFQLDFIYSLLNEARTA